MIYRMEDGTRVKATRTSPEGAEVVAYRFVKYHFEGAERVETDDYELSGDEAQHELVRLQTADGARFIGEFGPTLPAMAVPDLGDSVPLAVREAEWAVHGRCEFVDGDGVRCRFIADPHQFHFCPPD